jgi:hypothetical protein
VPGEAQTGAIANYREDLQQRMARKGAFLFLTEGVDGVARL